MGFTPRLMLLLKLKSSMGAFCGDSPLKFHLSMSRLLAIPIGASGIVKLGGAVTGWLCCDVVVSTVMEMVLPFSALAVGGTSCVLRSVSTCSVVHRIALANCRQCSRSILEAGGEYVLNRSSSALTYPLLGPLFLLTSSYAQLCPSRVQVLQLGLSPSHFNFLFLHIMHARRLGFGTLEFPPDPPSFAASPFWSETIIVSGGVPEEDDILFGRMSPSLMTRRPGDS